MPQMYDETFKKKMVRLRMEGRTINSIIQEYHISKSALTRWCEDYRIECQNNPEAQKDLDAMEEIRRLRKELEEARKENLFLKKAAAFFAKEID